MLVIPTGVGWTNVVAPLSSYIGLDWTETPVPGLFIFVFPMQK